jgi:hypothetical protein
MADEDAGEGTKAGMLRGDKCSAGVNWVKVFKEELKFGPSRSVIIRGRKLEDCVKIVVSHCARSCISVGQKRQ